ncbi:isoaspartyl peptidase/L-asparaginase family protein [Marinoscillum sp.]|uniref:isoaspartyl peptidase/L-asparaginase family protein n=1 Tax=Marinoscillum sp. TaxID=2024838 RepID=UPI003BAD47F3
MIKRRKFIGQAAVGAMSLSALQACASQSKEPKRVAKPVAISTWGHGMMANNESWQFLKDGGSALDAVERGVRVVESDPKVMTVGIGGFPDREGKVTLDACIMDKYSNCGSVAYLQDIVNPISVARKVMEETPHIMLVGAGAKQFALEQGFKEDNLLTPEAEKAYQNWLKESQYQPVINIENHDTISMLALDQNGDLAGACTTSGAAYKMNGRVGDSPIIGAGLFLDNEVGAAAATGLGEAVIRTAGSAMVVELMRQGKSPEEACVEVTNRIYQLYKKRDDLDYLQVGFIALNKQGEYAGYSLKEGFNYAIHHPEKQELVDARYSI